jgi:thiamine kinase-like enzyme
MKPVELAAVFAQIPLLDGLSPDDFTITQLPGYTNQNFRLHNQQQDWVLRIPKSATNRFIDRAAERYNQVLAGKLALSPQPSWYNPEGVSLTATLVASRGLTPGDFDDPKIVAGMVGSLQKLHRSESRFQGQVNLEALLHDHYELLTRPEQQRLRPRLQQARRVLKLLETSDLPYVPSHNDLVLENLLIDGTRLWLIDWEYSAMASPYWDLATLCNAAGLDLAQSRHLLQRYCAGGAAMEESTLFDYRGLLKLLSDCWMAALEN